MYYEFQSCDNDTIDTISLEHNADIALRNEGQKWFTWFSKECRNLNRLSAQLVRVQALMSEGHKVFFSDFFSLHLTTLNLLPPFRRWK